MNTSRCTKAFSRRLTPANFRFAFALIVSLIVLAGARANASAATITVNAGGDFQAALYAAQPGDTILLQAGTSFTGPFTLPVKSGASYITIRTSAPDSSLPASDVRVTPAYASVMPKLLAPANGESALRTAHSSHHYRFIGIEIKPSGNGLVYDLIQLGDGSNEQNQMSQVAHHLIFDRCYIHGNPSGQVKRCIAANGAHTSILNSHVSDCKGIGYDSQAIGGWNGPGPFTIINNFLEGAGENVMFGGAWAQTGLDPADLEFRRNHVSKPVSWRGVYTVKNLFELKNMKRAVIDGNVFEYNWPHAQSGYAIMLTPLSGDSGPNAVVEDIQFTNNIVRHSAQGIDMVGRDYMDPNYPNIPVQNKRVTIKNNLFYDIGGQWGGDGRFMMLTSGGGPDDLTIDHNTVIHGGAVLVLDGGPQARFIFNNNLMAHNDYGIIAVGWLGSGFGANALNLYAPGYVFRRNLIAGANHATFPADNFYPSSLDSAGFTNRAADNYRLLPSSPYKNAGTDGKDVGCDFDALYAAQAGTAGPGPSPSPTATPTPTPTPSPSPSPTPTGTPGVGFVDNFNDNVFDPAKWIYNTIQGAIYSGSAAWDATVPVLERNQRLEISPRSNVSGDHYNGYVFANAWNMTNSRATVEVIQSAAGTSDTNLALCLNSSNFYMVSVENGQLRFEQVVNGGRSTTEIAYNAAQHRHWRIRHEPTSDSIIFETSADAVSWAVRRTVVRQLQINSLRAEISAGTWEAISAPGTAIFDNFYLQSNSQLTPLASPMMVGSALQSAISLSSVPNANSTSIDALVTSIEQAYTVFVGEYSCFSSASSIDKNLRSALSYASMASMGPRSAIRKRLMNATQHLSEAHTLMQSTGARDSSAEAVASNTSLDTSVKASPPPAPSGASRRMRAAQFRAR